MATGSKKSKTLAAFNHPMPVEVREVKFEPLASVGVLDLARLSKGSHKIEVGFAEGGCCQRVVSAVIKNGMVTGLEIKGCGNPDKPVSKEMVAVVEAARRKIGRETPGKWKPVPVAEFFQSPAALRRIVIGDWAGWCITVCVKWGEHWHCLVCCLWPPNCFDPPIYVGPLE